MSVPRSEREHQARKSQALTGQVNSYKSFFRKKVKEGSERKKREQREGKRRRAREGEKEGKGEGREETLET